MIVRGARGMARGAAAVDSEEQKRQRVTGTKLEKQENTCATGRQRGGARGWAGAQIAWTNQEDLACSASRHLFHCLSSTSSPHQPLIFLVVLSLLSTLVFLAIYSTLQRTLTIPHLPSSPHDFSYSLSYSQTVLSPTGA